MIKSASGYAPLDPAALAADHRIGVMSLAMTTYGSGGSTGSRPPPKHALEAVSFFFFLWGGGGGPADETWGW